MERVTADVMVGVAAALNQAVDIDGVAAAMFEHVARAMGAGSVGLWLLDHDAGVLRLVGQAGFPDASVDEVRELDLTADLPGPDAVRRGVPVVYESREQRDARWPLL